MSNSVSRWEEQYKNNEQLWGSNADPRLIQFRNIVKEGNILDIGIGEGRNIQPFLKSKYRIYGVDLSQTAIDRCKERFNAFDLKLMAGDIREYDFKARDYSLVLSSNVLNFFSFKDALCIIANIKKSLSKDGIVYIQVLSTDDPAYETYKSKYEEIEKNTFYIERLNTNVHFFTKDEVEELFDDLEIICEYKGRELDLSHGNPHYHGIIDYMARKK